MKLAGRVDHPRVCGEHMVNYGNVDRGVGSSPRMRGTHIHRTVVRAFKGIIPAYAGNTFHLLETPRAVWDHPRVCGEHTLGYHLQASLIGIIPAYAGNTFPFRLSSVTTRDHPRVCGEHYIPIIAAYNLMGSSPRMRGTHAVRVGACDVHGIIPAYAGNTSQPQAYSIRSRDHPRVCGEHLRMFIHSVLVGGSSPRMRGTH